MMSTAHEMGLAADCRVKPGHDNEWASRVKEFALHHPRIAAVLSRIGFGVSAAFLTMASSSWPDL